MNKKNCALFILAAFFLIMGGSFISHRFIRMVVSLTGGCLGVIALGNLFVMAGEERRQRHQRFETKQIPSFEQLGLPSHVERMALERMALERMALDLPIITATQFNRPNVNRSNSLYDYMDERIAFQDYLDRISLDRNADFNLGNICKLEKSSKESSMPLVPPVQDPVIKKVKSAIEQLEVSG